ncbi:MAG: hypothetical protein FWC50_12340 [Planctomycetaceae bacterium]|nr:hypothetical protein [Planctomycetaceae bacterium]
MTNRFSLLCVLMILCVFAGQGCRRQSKLLESATIKAKGLEKANEFTLYFQTPEKLAQMPVAVVKRPPKQPGETQRIDLFLYRKIEDITEEGERIPCRPANIEGAKTKDGTDFKVNIPFSRADENPFQIFINGKEGTGKVTAYSNENTM